MKRWVFVVVSIFLLVSANAHASLIDGLMGHWSFDDQNNPVVDDSGNANHGVNNSATWVSNGILGGAMSFDGTDSYIEVADSLSLDITGPISMATWIKADPSQYFRVGLIQKRPSLEPSQGYDLLLGELGRTNMELVVSNSPSPSILGQVESNTAVTDNQWHHIAATYDGNVMRMYVDGLLENTTEWTTGYLTNDEPLFISMFQYGYNDGHGNLSGSLNGDMDDVRIYNRALSAGEVASLVPEPSTATLLTIGTLLGLTQRRRRVFA